MGKGRGEVWGSPYDLAVQVSSLTHMRVLEILMRKVIWSEHRESQLNKTIMINNVILDSTVC